MPKLWPYSAMALWRYGHHLAAVQRNMATNVSTSLWFCGGGTPSGISPALTAANAASKSPLAWCSACTHGKPVRQQGQQYATGRAAAERICHLLCRAG